MLYTAFAILVWFLVGMFILEAGWRGRIVLAVIVAVSLALPKLVGGDKAAVASAAGVVLRTLVAVTYLIKRKYDAALR